MTLMELHALISVQINLLAPEPDPPEAVASPGNLAMLRSMGLMDIEGNLVTEKGEAYIQALQAVPLPVQRWVIPEVPHAVEKRVEPSGRVVEHQDRDGSGQAAEASGRHRAQRGGKKQPAPAKE